MAKRLRFAALIRVSTEKQENEGESLRTQRKQIEQAVKSVGGEIVDWYGGQEHATEGWERQELDRLIADAQKKHRQFDAVIVADASRWSRDPVASEQHLEVLREHDVRFFVLSQEHDLHNDDARLFLGMSALINGYSARVTVRKSFENRIERAKRGIPTAGSLPFGRTFDKKTEQWGIDREKQREMQRIAKRYLKGERLVDIARDLGIGQMTIYTRLKRCGDKFPVEFKSDKLKRHETIEMEVPPLLDEKTMAAIRQRMKNNRTIDRKHLKHRYLLSKVVVCGYCGSALSGQANEWGRYYRHFRKKECKLQGYIPADDLERTVMIHLFDAFGNPAEVERAIKAAIPNRDQLDEAHERLCEIAEQLEKTEANRDRIMGRLMKGTLSEDKADKYLDEVNDREAELHREQERLNQMMSQQPNPARVKAISEQVSKGFKPIRLTSAILTAKCDLANYKFDKMTWEDQRTLVKLVFSGELNDGRRMGVYVTNGDGERRWRFVLRGHLIDQEGYAPRKIDPIEDYFGLSASRQRELMQLGDMVTDSQSYPPH